MSARKSLCAFPWYGGKQKHLGWLLPLLPECHHYCEPFGGAASVLLNRAPSPVETYNDLDGEVVNFFRVLREQTEELTRLVALTPYSREEFALACEGSGNGVNDLERARRFYVRAMQSFGASQTGGHWGTCISTRNLHLSEKVSQWICSIGGLGVVRARLLRAQIENRPALQVIRAYDSPDTLFYCDPPYPLQSRTAGEGYRHEMTDDQHRELAVVLHGVEGRVAISSYPCDLMSELYADWHLFDAGDRGAGQAHSLRQHVLYTNYDPAAHGTPRLPFGERNAR